jgi:hypothetical protein
MVGARLETSWRPIKKMRRIKMSITDIKIYAMNAGALGVTTFTRIEDGLKIFLLLVTIGYTISKWIELKKNK